jgi:hypothetical protein
MKIRDLITQLASLDPEGNVEGVENLRLSISLISPKGSAIPIRYAKRKKFLKGAERAACAREEGEPALVAAKYGVSTATVWQLRRDHVEGKI